SPILRIVSPDDVSQQEADANTSRVQAEDAAKQNDLITNSLIAFIDNQFGIMTRHRDGANGWTDRLTLAMRVFKGEYDTQKLMQIRKFGGSEVYARLTASKCRGATSFFCNVYATTEK